jgi:hypothetical protein
MRVLCVGRHSYLSEHLCRVFSDLGAECREAVGPADALAVAGRFEPHVMVCDCDLLSESLLAGWTREPSLVDVPVIAVSLTRRPDDELPPPVSGDAGVVYLPGLDREQLRALMTAAYRPRGVQAPTGLRVGSPQATAARHTPH